MIALKHEKSLSFLWYVSFKELCRSSGHQLTFTRLPDHIYEIILWVIRFIWVSVYMCMGHCQARRLNYCWPADLLGFNNSVIFQSVTHTERKTSVLEKKNIGDTHHLISHCLRASSVWDGASETQDAHGLHLHKRAAFTTAHSLMFIIKLVSLMFYIIAVILLMCRRFFPLTQFFISIDASRMKTYASGAADEGDLSALRRWNVYCAPSFLFS